MWLANGVQSLIQFEQKVEAAASQMAAESANGGNPSNLKIVD
jgi:hypothetical protein